MHERTAALFIGSRSPLPPAAASPANQRQLNVLNTYNAVRERKSWMFRQDPRGRDFEESPEQQVFSLQMVRLRQRCCVCMQISCRGNKSSSLCSRFAVRDPPTDALFAKMSTNPSHQESGMIRQTHVHRRTLQALSPVSLSLSLRASRSQSS